MEKSKGGGEGRGGCVVVWCGGVVLTSGSSARAWRSCPGCTRSSARRHAMHVCLCASALSVCLCACLCVCLCACYLCVCLRASLFTCLSFYRVSPTTFALTRTRLPTPYFKSRSPSCLCHPHYPRTRYHPQSTPCSLIMSTHFARAARLVQAHAAFLLRLFPFSHDGLQKHLLPALCRIVCIIS